ncbi:Multidrug ACR family efflux system [Stenotrophomonas sp. RIT309]|uniref:multidrug efflux RND transporter permease subunit n=1 Tax=Stenotrophomonas TaxID=40323 RepID=UPI000453AC81|nr:MULTISPECIES: multidrug efflux RND transporter permease subunit [Stenotrophomonas]EZP46586.1 Multidrug ACR family efflux system [Stenotrophomonas sp. RIT309]WGV54937.1 multidrug efflux RND transporter permease subunit [Stenotrophomonas indicatrix]
MARFFIDRPVFAWVLAIFVILAGVLAIPRLAVERYPAVAPPSVSIYASYPGASPQTLNDAVVGLIERELSSVKHLLYFESSVDTSGEASITATFKPGTDPELAQVDVQNRIKAIEPRLPRSVRQNGLFVEAADSGFLMLVGLRSPDGSVSEAALGDFMARNIIEELRRIDGVGRVQLFGAEQAMRIWLDPTRLTGYGLTMGDVASAIEQQNLEISPGRIGDSPGVPGQRITVPLSAEGQLSTPGQFAAIVLRAGADGSRVLLGDVARVELGAQSYAWGTREDGYPATAAGVQLRPGANAVRTATAVRERMADLQPLLPQGVESSIPFDTAPFVKVSIQKVLQTLIEAMLLVFAVMYLFLQNWRYTLIPALVAPIALLGTFAVMLALGFSINVLTMFGMVLAIGIIVDDAIVVVEGVERIMAEEGLPPREATIKAMRELTGAVIGITLVLTAVFIPMALASGSVGAIYRQFSVAMSVSILFSALLALSLTPALCATLLRQGTRGHHGRGGVFGAFNRGFERMTGRYQQGVAAVLRRSGRVMGLFAALLVALLIGLHWLPGAFLPEEDQGYFMTSIQLPAEATAERTLAVVEAYEQHVASRPAIASNQAILGYSFSGSGPSAALTYTMLKDWGERGGSTASDEVKAAQQAMATVPEGEVMSVMPPAIDSLGRSSGFSLALQARTGQGQAELRAALQQLLKLAEASPLLADVNADGLPAGSNVRLDIDRAKAEAMGVAFTDISATLSAAMGSQYVNDFPNRGRMQQVIMQADAPYRMELEDVLKLYVRNSEGGMVALSELVTPHWTEAPLQLQRYLGFPALNLSGTPAGGVSTGQAMVEMERLAQQLPAGFALQWTSQSLQERESGAQAPWLLLLSMLVVFLVLAALYESWSIPLAVMLVVPLGLLGAVAAVLLREMPNDVFFKVGMITVIGLSAKNAILIVEFARQLQQQGRGLVEATIEAARLRLRPIVMTSLAFALGVVPLMLAQGASKETQQAIGTGVFGGMVSATVLAVFFVPVFYVVVQGAQQWLAQRLRRRRPTPGGSVDGKQVDGKQER